MVIMIIVVTQITMMLLTLLILLILMVLATTSHDNMYNHGVTASHTNGTTKNNDMNETTTNCNTDSIVSSGTIDHTDNLNNLDNNDITDNDDITGHTYMFDNYKDMPCPQGLLGKCCVLCAPCPQWPFYVLWCELLLTCKVQFKWHGCDWPWPQQQDDNALATEGLACS